MKKLTIVYALLSLFLIGCTGCMASKPVVASFNADAHKNLAGQKRLRAGAQRAITINWVDREHTQKACIKCVLKKNSKHTL